MGSRAWRVGGHIRGMDSEKSWKVGITACHEVEYEVLSRMRVAAKRPCMVMGPMPLDMIFGTV